MKKIITVLCFSLFLLSCTDNSRARRWGGSEKVELPKSHRFINATWK